MQIAADDFIQKKLLYKFDKRIQSLFQSIYHLQSFSLSGQNQMIDQKQQTDKSKLKYLNKQSLLQQIQQLKFQNFKYRTALISAHKDQLSNQQILIKAVNKQSNKQSNLNIKFKPYRDSQKWLQNVEKTNNSIINQQNRQNQPINLQANRTKNQQTQQNKLNKCNKNTKKICQIMKKTRTCLNMLYPALNASQTIRKRMRETEMEVYLVIKIVLDCSVRSVVIWTNCQKGIKKNLLQMVEGMEIKWLMEIILQQMLIRIVIVIESKESSWKEEKLFIDLLIFISVGYLIILDYY